MPGNVGLQGLRLFAFFTVILITFAQSLKPVMLLNRYNKHPIGEGV